MILDHRRNRYPGPAWGIDHKRDFFTRLTNLSDAFEERIEPFTGREESESPIHLATGFTSIDRRIVSAFSTEVQPNNECHWRLPSKSGTWGSVVPFDSPRGPGSPAIVVPQTGRSPMDPTNSLNRSHPQRTKVGNVRLVAAAQTAPHLNRRLPSTSVILRHLDC